MQTNGNYDEFATIYNEDNERNAYNALYERPATLALVGAVAGLRVLDAGCGGGAHAAALVASGATVTGIDKSQALLAIARERLGPKISLIRADLETPLGFADQSFDVVLASLIMHYLRDWQPVLTEFKRILAPGGRLVMSTHHPFMDHLLAGRTNYFETYEFADQWHKGGRTIHIKYWHRPLRARWKRRCIPGPTSGVDLPRKAVLRRTKARLAFICCAANRPFRLALYGGRAKRQKGWSRNLFRPGASLQSLSWLNRCSNK